MPPPSFSSFPPTFSTFPEIEAGPSKARSEAVSSLSRGDKSHSKSKRHSAKHKEKKRSPRSHTETQLTVNEPPELHDEVVTRPFYSDRKGDPLNVQYGGLHTGDIPKYRPIIGGKSILGLPRGWTTIQHQRGIEVAPFHRKKMSALTDSKTRAVLAAPPTRRILQSRGKDLYEGPDGYLRLTSGRASDSHEPLYRSITVGDPDADPDFSSSGGESSSEDDSGEESEEFTLTLHQEKLKQLDQTIQENPSSVDTWLRLLSETLSTIPETSKNATKARCEITLSILERAMAADTWNGTSKILRLKYIKAGEEIWQEGKVAAEWEDALKGGGIEMWIEWLEWRFRKGNGGIEGIVEDAARVLGTLGQNESDEVAKLRVFWRVAVGFQNAGFPERATAMFQAQAELAFRTPDAFHKLPMYSRIDKLEEFWESEAPRLGEEGAEGWAAWIASGEMQQPPRFITKPTQASHELDPYREWAASELNADRMNNIPTRSSEDSDGADPYSTIFLSDVRPLLLDLQYPRAKHLFRLVLLSVLGLHVPGLSSSLSSVDQINWDDRWSLGHLRRPSYLNVLFPDTNQNRLTTDAVAGVIIGREIEYASGFGPVQSWTYDVFEPLNIPSGGQSTKAKGKATIWHKEDLEGLDESYVRRIFAQLSLGDEDYRWDTLSLAFEAAVSVRSAIKQSRSFLSSHRNSVPHWKAHAQLERVRNRTDDCRKVYQTVLIASSSPTRKGVGPMWWDWAEMEWLDGAREQALHVILRSVGIEGQGGVAILRGKRSLEEAGVETTEWKEREAWIKLRVLLEVLTTNEPSGALRIFDEYLRDWTGDGASRESLTVASLLILYHYSVTLKNPMPPIALRERVSRGFSQYPNNSVILGLFLEGEKGQGVWGRVRGILGESGGIEKSISRRIAEVWIAGWQSGRWLSEVERTRSGLAAAVENERTRSSHVLWRVYLELEIRAGQPQRAKKLLFRAIGECPLVKELYLLAFGPLRGVFNTHELNGLADTMVERGIRLRKGLDEALEGWGGEEKEIAESVEGSGDEIEESARELRRLMPY